MAQAIADKPTSGSPDTAPRRKEPLKQRFFRAVVRHRVPIVVAYVIAAAVCLWMRQFVAVNYDITSYLPDAAASTVALDVMGEEFEGDIANCRVMVADVSLAKAREVKDELLQIDGVTAVTWLDDVADLDEPLEVQDSDSIEAYYKDGCALYSVTVDSDKNIQTVADLREFVGDEGAVTGSAASNADATTATESQIQLITVAVIAFILLILVLTTNTWIEPLIVLCGLGISVFINWGTNLVFGEISFVTNSAGSILQVAIALDFSVFLLHRYAEVRGTNATREDDMVESLCKSSVAIFSSGCTVTIGFLALCAMQFKIGPDLGLSLAKGIVISLATVFTFTPGLFVICDPLIDKTRHRRLIPQFDGFAGFVSKVCVPVMIVLLAVCIPANKFSTSDSIEYYYGNSHMFGEGTELGEDIDKIEAVFGDSDMYVVMVPRGSVSKEAELSDALKDLDHVTGVLSYVDVASQYIPTGMAEDSVLSQVESDNVSRLVVTVDVPYEGDETFELVGQIRSVADEYYPGEAMVAGEGVSTTDLKDTITEDKAQVDLISVAAVFVVLLIATKSISLPVILVLVIETSIWLNFSIPYFSGQKVFFLSYLICSTIQLGVAVDYGILIADRYREDRVRMGKKDALRDTMASCTVPVLTSGTVLVVSGFAMYAISTHGVLLQLGYYLGIGVLFSLVAVLFALPGFLYVFDGLIARTTLHSNFLKEPKKHSKKTGPDDPAPAYSTNR